MTRTVKICDRTIGPGHPCYIIAEAGVNHNGDLALAKELVGVAAKAGADAVKFQTFKADALVAVDAPKADYQKETTGPGESQLEMLKSLELSREAHSELVKQCSESGIIFMSTPFDYESADFLCELGVAAIKIPSGEVTNLPLLEHVARKGKPIILSTGMSDFEEVEAAVGIVRSAGCDELVLLHCVSNYPADPADANLRAMETMAKAFGVPVGYSDHTVGIEVALGAVALGACVIEKHFTLDKTMAGPDHRASLEPGELKALVKGIRKVEASLGDGRKVPTESEADTAAAARRSLVAACEIVSGTKLTEEMVEIKRPGTGLPPSMLTEVVGKVVSHDLRKGGLITMEVLK